MEFHSPICVATDDRTAELDRLGDEIAELAAHLAAATARLLDLIREFDARGGWGNGFKSCAHWEAYRCWPRLSPVENCRTRRSGP
ncbi:MAG TPA: hypothetical protein VFR64_17405 [Methylomirabilota bacterium]|nr:hypothetical protein [Methylomirabilota bacterium]